MTNELLNIMFETIHTGCTTQNIPDLIIINFGLHSGIEQLSQTGTSKDVVITAKVIVLEASSMISR